MDTSFPGDGKSDTQSPIRLLTSLHGLGVVWKWLAGIMRLTKQEEEDAGIYLGD